jgi:FkbM family methyltransferase
MPHKARSFATPPAPDEAQALLADVATAPCPFAPVTAEGPLALYGAGDLGHLARDFLKAVGRDFDFVIDRNARKLAQTPDWSAVTLLHPDDVPDMAKNDVRLAVTVVTAPYVAIEQSLLQHGFKEVVPFYDVAESFRQQHPLSNGWFAAPLSPEDRKHTARVLAGWADDVSRAHHLQFLAWRRLREEWLFEQAPVSNSDRFFIPEIASVLNGHEVLLDGGAHYGNVTTMFARLTNGAYRAIIAVEPDPSNRARFRENAAANDIRVSIHDCALAESEGQTQFHDGLGYASQISTTGRMNVVTRPLDALGVSPTYIKLHLEGAEFNALKGARETLLSCRPIVTATVYHNADGIWRTPLWLMETLPRYRFLFRAHSWCGTGAVIYAIPNERYGA